MIKQYRKKPVVIEAVQWNGKNFREIADFMDCRHHDFEFEDQASRLYIQTLEGTMEAKTGDYIIKGVKGEFYPCKPDVFEATYEHVVTATEVDKESHTLDDGKTHLNDDCCDYVCEKCNARMSDEIEFMMRKGSFGFCPSCGREIVEDKEVPI